LHWQAVLPRLGQPERCFVNFRLVFSQIRSVSDGRRGQPMKRQKVYNVTRVNPGGIVLVIDLDPDNARI
jgi:hypothetical protein